MSRRFGKPFKDFSQLGLQATFKGKSLQSTFKHDKIPARNF